MVIAYTTLVILVCFLMLLNTRHIWSVHATRRHGKLPRKGTATMFNVRYLLMEGERELAIELYCEIFNTTPGKARKDIDELQRSLKV